MHFIFSFYSLDAKPSDTKRPWEAESKLLNGGNAEVKYADDGIHQ